MHRSLNSHVSVLPRACTWVYKQANFSQKSLSPRLLHRIQLLLSSLHFNTGCCPGPGFTEEELFFPGVPMPSRPLLLMYRLARVHQEDRSYLFSWRVHAQSTAAVPVPPYSCPPRGPQLFLGGVQTTAHCSRTCSLTHCQRRRNILISIVIYLAAFWLPKSLDYSGRAIQVRTKERAIQVHTQERAIQVHGILVHHYVSRSPLVLMHYSCTAP